MKIFIATPMYGGMAKSVYVAGISDLSRELAAKGHTVTHTSITNESLVTRARNTLANEFMKTDFDALLFIDADHGFVAEDIVAMIESGKDLIGAPYPMKAIDWNNVRKAALAGKEDLELYSGLFAINFLDEEQTFKSNEPFRVKDIGTGMMFIRRTVFEQLKAVCETYRFNTIGDIIPFGQEIVEYFKTMVTPEPEKILLSEDYAFCRIWREIGGEVWAAPWVRISHAGEYNFSGMLLATLEIGQVNAIDEEAEKKKK